MAAKDAWWAREAAWIEEEFGPEAVKGVRP